MRVLVIASFAPSLRNFRGPLLSEMLRMGLHVTVAAPDFASDERAALESMGLVVCDTPMQRTGMNPIKDLGYLRALRSLIRRTRPDLLFSYTIKPNIWGAIAARSLNVESVALVTGLGFAFTQNANLTPRARIARLLATRLYRIATACNRTVIFQNPDDQTDFVNAGCLQSPSKARRVNGSGVDLNHYAPAPAVSEPIFLMVARLLGNKGVREYAQASMKVKATCAGARFLLVGYLDEGPDGIGQKELDAWIQGGLEYLGPRSDVRPALKSAAVYVLPSYREGTPRSVLEAMAMGRPVITTDAPGCRETVVDGQTGFLVPVGDVAALVDKIIWMIEHPDERLLMGDASLALAREKFDVTKVNEQLIEHLGLRSQPEATT